LPESIVPRAQQRDVRIVTPPQESSFALRFEMIGAAGVRSRVNGVKREELRT
jgi:hypothetical protein